MKNYLNSLEKIDKIVFTIVGIMLLLILINGCTPETDVCEQGERNNGVVCTEIYQPVITPDGTEYPNACYAGVDGWDNSCLELKPIYD
jgi:hypothetical protein